MSQNNLFHRTRWQLAFWYASVMGLILSLCGATVYNAMARAHWVALNSELKSMAGTLHDDIEPTLKQPGRLEPSTWQLLPDACLAGSICGTQTSAPKRHILGAVNQGDRYYMRLFDRLGRPIALAGVHPQGLALVLDKDWQTLSDRKGNRYRQISLSLHTQNYIPWGYMQVGQNLKDFDDYLATLRWVLSLGLPMAMGLIGVSSWLLAGLAMQPIRQSYQLLQQFTADVPSLFIVASYTPYRIAPFSHDRFY